MQLLKPQVNFESVSGAHTVLYARWVGTAVSLSSIKRAMAQGIKRERERVKDEMHSQKREQMFFPHVLQDLHL